MPPAGLPIEQVLTSFSFVETLIYSIQYPSHFISWGYRGEYFQVRHGESLKKFIMVDVGLEPTIQNPWSVDDAIY